MRAVQVLTPTGPSDVEIREVDTADLPHLWHYFRGGAYGDDGMLHEAGDVAVRVTPEGSSTC